MTSAGGDQVGSGWLGATGERRAALPRRTVAVLARPLPALCLATWVINDAWGKDAWPGWVTGKLSDVGGVFVFPLVVLGLVSMVTGRRRVGPTVEVAPFVLTAAVFGAMKLHNGANEAVEAALAAAFGGPQRIVMDPTDALLVPLVVASWAYWRRVAPQLDRSGSAAVALGVAGRVALGVGLVATTATSCLESGIGSIAVREDGRLSVVDGSTLHHSDDGGRTWVADLTVSVPPAATTAAGSARACDPRDPDPAHCIAIEGRSLVETTASAGAGSEPRTVYTQPRALQLRPGGGCDGLERTLRDVVVLDHDGETVVLAATGGDGIVARFGDGGTWQRIGVGSSTPMDLGIGALLPELVLVVLLAPVFPFGFLAARRSVRPSATSPPLRGLAALGVVAAVVVIATALAVAAAVFDVFNRDPLSVALAWVGGAALAGVAVIGSLLLLAVGRRRHTGGADVALALTFGVVGWVVPSVLWLWWERGGAISLTGVRVAVVWLVMAAALACGVVAGRRRSAASVGHV
ncbi:MAG: hypothetical protein S0880_34660 [Actinomycetota bacterium]|nr:hypothetical protein [Actinomycetota bacterium]